MSTSHITPCLWFNADKPDRIMNTVDQMKKFDIAALESAFEGETA